MAKFYHYVADYKVKRLAEYGKKELTPNRRFITYNEASGLPHDAYRGALWGLHNPEPDICESGFDVNPNIDCIRKQCAGGDKLHLLEITIAPEDNIYVCDTAVFKDTREMPYDPDDSLQACRIHDAFLAYYNSLIPFNNYENRQYAEPEVVCFNPIPITRVKLLKTSEDFYTPPQPVDPDELLGLLNFD